MNPISQMIPTEIKLWTTPDEVSPAYFEENLVRELPLELWVEDKNALLFRNNEQLGAYNVSYNSNQKIVVDLAEEEIIVISERQISLKQKSIYMTLSGNENSFYKLISQENQLLHNLGSEMINEQHNVYRFVLIQHVDKQNNFKINPFTLPTTGNTEFKITELKINKVPINRIYGVSEHHKKQEILFKKTSEEQPIPIVLAPISSEHDVKMWDIYRDPEKAMELTRIVELIKLEKAGNNTFDKITSTLLPPVSKRTLQQVVQISFAADSAFEGIPQDGKVSGIAVDRITKMSADIAVNFKIQNTILKNDPNIRESQEWILFSQWMYAASHAIALPDWMLPSGKSEENKILLLFYIDITIDSDAVYDTDGNVPDSKIKFRVRSLYYDIDTTDINNIKFTLKPTMYKFLNSMNAFRTPDPFTYPELPKQINAKNESANVNIRIFDQSSQIKKYLFWLLGNQDSLRNILTKTTYANVEEVQKQLSYDWNQSFYSDDYKWIESLPNAKARNQSWITITNVKDGTFVEIIKHTYGIPFGYKPISMQIKQSYDERRIHFGGRGTGTTQQNKYRLEVILTVSNKDSLPDVTELIQNPILDADKFLEKVQQVVGTGQFTFDINKNDSVPYIYIRAWLLSHYEITISYKDKDKKEQTITRSGWWPHQYDNSITEFKLAVNQKINI